MLQCCTNTAWACLNAARTLPGHASMLHAPCSFLQVTALSALTAALGTDVSKYANSNYTTNSTCPADNTAGGILGDSIGQLTATANMDSSFYSWVGCNCSNGDDERQYDIDTSGDVQYILMIVINQCLMCDALIFHCTRQCSDSNMEHHKHMLVLIGHLNKLLC